MGGWGTLQHGATRLTQDLDICPRLTTENLERLAAALTDLHAELQITPEETVPVPISDGRLLSQMQIGNWNTDAGGLDVLQQIQGADGRELKYDHLAERAIRIEDDGRTFQVASLADITASKRASLASSEMDAAVKGG
jgi:hypothetical protein